MSSSATLTKVGSLAISVSDLPANATAGRRWKFKRNLVIYTAHRAGLSQRWLAEVFDLPHSRVTAIVKEFRSKYES